MNKTEHLLVCLAEECAEVQQAVTKALRFGLTDGRPQSTATNAEDISAEFSDVLAIIELLEEEGVLSRMSDIHAVDRKKARVREFMAYAKVQGTLHDAQCK